MRDLLDRYQAMVGADFGHERHGPGRARWARSVKLQIDRETEALKRRQAEEAAATEARRAAEAKNAFAIYRAELGAEHERAMTVERARLSEVAKAHVAAYRARIDREHQIAEARRDELVYETLLSGEKSNRRLKQLERETTAFRNELASALALIEAHGLRPPSLSI
ncbi:hypothetical protein [Methylopila turkensis]|nr:hypothetical protein [Methylopila turkensis]